MENASKALMLAAEVLIGVIILTIAVTLFRTFSDFGKQTYEQVEADRIAEWNSNYLKYYGNISIEIPKANNKTETVTAPIPVTAHDIVTMANHARQNNVNYDFSTTNPIKAKSNLYYVQIDIKLGNKITENFESDKEDKNAFLSAYSLKQISANETQPIYFKINQEPKLSSETKRVYYVQLEEFSNAEYQKYEKIATYRNNT